MKNVVIRSLVAAGKRIAGTFQPPPDKSITHRALFFGSLSTEPSRIKNPLLSGDCLSTAGAFRALGVPVRIAKGAIAIGRGKRSGHSLLRKLSAPRRAIDCGNSGTTMRLLSGVLAAQPFRSRLVGDASLSRRPMRRVIEPLTLMGARVVSRNGCAPLTIHGTPHLKALLWHSLTASAQVKSAVLLAGLFAKGRTEVAEPCRSRDHSERMLARLGANVRFQAGGSPEKSNVCSVTGGSRLAGVRLTVPGDFSSAAFFIAAALIVPGSRLKIRSVNLNPTRTGLLKVLKRMGARIKIVNRSQAGGEPVGDLVVFHSHLRGTLVKKSEIPLLIDEIPILAVIASQARGKTEVRGAEELRVKETDRIRAVVTELKKMGAAIEERKDGFAIKGPTALRGAHVRSYHDHRMAMSLAVAALTVLPSSRAATSGRAALAAGGETEIKDFDCVRISFPGFLKALKGLVR